MFASSVRQQSRFVSALLALWIPHGDYIFSIAPFTTDGSRFVVCV